LNATNESWTIRAPWPDEEERLRRHFLTAAGGSPTSRSEWRRVIVAGEIERLVGLAELHRANPEAGGKNDRALALFCEVRAAWASRPATDALIQEALAQARARQAGEVVAAVPADGALDERLRVAGFVHVGLKERWRVPVPEALAKLEARGASMLAHAPVAVAPIDHTDLERVREICTATGLLSAERVFPVGDGGEAGGFDRGLSFFAGDPARPDAVLLARERAGAVYLEVLARHPRSRTDMRTSVVALLRALFQAARRHERDDVYCEMTPSETPGLVALVRRVGGVRIAALRRLRRDMGDGA
jgi:hypothetical protein